MTDLANARITTNLRVVICDYSHKQLVLGPFSALRSLRNKEPQMVPAEQPDVMSCTK